MRPFHLAFPVTNLDAARAFYVDRFGCAIGRTSERWIDFDFFGHQITAHLVESPQEDAGRNAVDGDSIRVPHFGVILDKSEWEKVRDRITERCDTFLLAPKIRFVGEPGEQGTFFVSDPSGNVLEFKYFNSDADIFRT
ncbi:predicted dioxygenase of extradiol dioxygenase family [Hahella chejuensis KCTC 2396]|uniref:Predicted dioxygenase of extradiol dioxygenase family n=1 Tax=Hahella chejuensis (strain KCTC 2396) TaxID=349521 RepID=Q2S7E1_HAHCH|nr:VOC family protein [Hahella chejuensis]ABC33433.1 predicted dioxygenase of extradiol dioxygenase family [Hahella chejuensis KCTC 2396]